MASYLLVSVLIFGYPEFMCCLRRGVFGAQGQPETKKAPTREQRFTGRFDGILLSSNLPFVD